MGCTLSPWGGGGVRPGSGLGPREDFPAQAKGCLWETQQGGSDPKEAIPRLPGKTAGWWGREGGRLQLPGVSAEMVSVAINTRDMGPGRHSARGENWRGLVGCNSYCCLHGQSQLRGCRKSHCQSGQTLRLDGGGGALKTIYPTLRCEDESTKAQEGLWPS